jgi:hypothetical protein
VGSKAGLDAVEKRKISFPCRESNPDRLACSLTVETVTGDRNCKMLSSNFNKHRTLEILSMKEKNSVQCEIKELNSVASVRERTLPTDRPTAACRRS